MWEGEVWVGMGHLQVRRQLLLLRRRHGGVSRLVAPLQVEHARLLLVELRERWKRLGVDHLLPLLLPRPLLVEDLLRKLVPRV